MTFPATARHRTADAVDTGGPTDSRPSDAQTRLMNHVPDDVLDAIDTFGEQLLVGTPPRVGGRLRQDLRMTITPDGDGETALVRYETEHTQTPPVLRDRGSYVTTIVDGVDGRLRSWGIEPPAAYEYTETVEDTHRYEGRVGLP